MKKKNLIVIAVVCCVVGLTGCTKSSQVVEQGSQTEENVSVIEDKSQSNGESNILQRKEASSQLLFSTEYIVEGYCHGCYIVSK